VSLFERLGCSEAYWAYTDGIERTPSFQAIHRPYPQLISGALKSYHYAPEARTFTCAWEEQPEVTAPSQFYLPGWMKGDARSMQVTPPGNGFGLSTVRQGSESLYLSVYPTGVAQMRRLVIQC
jgi:hypothetical protein